ncbi:MAG: hypothetical protein HY048_13150 [Acidobacteria bacterium]|nr:hypothetical protein [Acidobacteriota bacterium]
MLLGLALTVAPPWRPAPAGHRIALSPGALLPPIFSAATVLAQGGAPVTTGCKGTPIPSDPLLGNQDGELSITMNSLSLLTAANVEAKIFTSAKKLNFAKSAGVFGTFASGVTINAATYTQVKGVVSGTIAILCAVKYNKTTKNCDTDTYVTNGGTQLTDADCVSSGTCTAKTSNITLSAGDQSFTTNLPTAVAVSAGITKQIDMYFNNNAACELWDISTLKSHTAGTDFKILPGSQSPSQAKVP